MVFLVSFNILFRKITNLLSYPAHKRYWAFCLCHDVPGVYDAPTLKQKECGEMTVLVDNLDGRLLISPSSTVSVGWHSGISTQKTDHQSWMQKRTILLPNTRWLYHRIKIGLIADNLNTALGPLWQSLTAIDPGMDLVRYNSHQ